MESWVVSKISNRMTFPPAISTSLVVREPRSRPRKRSVAAMASPLPRKPFEEGLDADAELSGVLLGIVGHDLDAGDAGLLQGGGDADGLDVVRVAILKDVLDDAVDVMIAGEANDGSDPLVVRREAGAVDR